jgi:hypothetical protein
MSNDYQVSFAKHNIFYKKFFERHAKMINNFISLNFINVNKGFDFLISFYSSYSYYLQNEDNILEHIYKTKSNYQQDKEYKLLIKKVGTEINLNNLSLNEFLNFNNSYFERLHEILKIFEYYIELLAPEDLFPNLTDNYREYDKSILFANYETFYENLFTLHNKICDLLGDFSIFNFKDIFLNVLSFYYGNSFYIKRSTKNNLESDILNIWNIYNNKETLTLFFKLLNSSITFSELDKLKEIESDLFLKLNNIFSKLNIDLSSQNLMPKRKERVTIDLTLI